MTFTTIINGKTALYNKIEFVLTSGQNNITLFYETLTDGVPNNNTDILTYSISIKHPDAEFDTPLLDNFGTPVVDVSIGTRANQIGSGVINLNEIGITLLDNITYIMTFNRPQTMAAGTVTLNLSEQTGFRTIPTYAPEDAFVTVWNATAGVNVSLPLIVENFGDYAIIDWGDGTIEAATTINHDQNHIYESSGLYTVSVSGRASQYGQFSPSQQVRCVDILQWGNMGIQNWSNGFYGSSLTNVTATDGLSGMIIMDEMFKGTTLVTIDVSNWDTSKLRSVGEMFSLCDDLITPDISVWDVSNLQFASRFFRSTDFNDEIYDKVLTSWSAQNLQSGVTIDFGLALYTKLGARSILTDTYGWNITDGGRGSIALLGLYPGAQTAFSMNYLINDDYYGSAFRVRRDNDNAELDIGFIARDVDEGALSTFVGANSAYVTTTYDQSGNGNDWTQATASRQPRIVNSGVFEKVNNKLAMFSDDTALTMDNLKVGNIVGSATTTAFHVFKDVHTVAQNVIINTGLGMGATYYGLMNGLSTDPTNADAGTPVNYINGDVVVGDTAADMYNVSNGIQVFNSYTSLDLSSINWSEFNTNNTNVDTVFSPTYIQETIIYNSDQAVNREAIESDINFRHNVVAVPVFYSAQTAFSMNRRLLSTYAGSAFRIRRDNDNAELDIGFVGVDINADIDQSAITTFVGANSAYVTVAYDQTGNGRDWVQGTASRQPRIVNAGVLNIVDGQLAMHNLANTSLKSAVGGSATSAAFHVVKILTGNKAINYETVATAAYGAASPFFTTVEPYDLFVDGSSVVNTGVNLETAILNKKSLVSYPTLDLSAWNEYNTGEDAFGGFLTASDYVYEAIIFDTDQSANRLNIDANIVGYYSL